MKIYTKSGDKGVTSLYDGTRVGKHAAIISAIGAVDEIASNIGMLICYSDANDKLSPLWKKEIAELSRIIQCDLQNINSYLATLDKDKRGKITKITDKDISRLEDAIDHMSNQIPALTKFVLPGGACLAESSSHLCRVITRRAEREIYKAYEELEKFDVREPRPENILKYINRLSDFFFALARFLLHFGSDKEEISIDEVIRE